eukprot:g358.t1
MSRKLRSPNPVAPVQLPQVRLRLEALPKTHSLEIVRVFSFVLHGTEEQCKIHLVRSGRGSGGDRYEGKRTRLIRISVEYRAKAASKAAKAAAKAASKAAPKAAKAASKAASEAAKAASKAAKAASKAASTAALKCWLGREQPMAYAKMESCAAAGRQMIIKNHHRRSSTGASDDI